MGKQSVVMGCVSEGGGGRNPGLRKGRPSSSGSGVKEKRKDDATGSSGGKMEG